MFRLIQSIQKRDPVQPGFWEVFFGYNGFHAVLWHRFAHKLWLLKLRALSRFFANLGRILTGVEIHPAAQIGRCLFIDHGTGIVIGQTAIVGDNVTIYHGVTLGGVGRSGNASGKRHPTVLEGAMIGSGAQILGDITIGVNAKIGSNSVVTSDIPDDCTAIGIPARIVCQGDKTSRAYGLPSREEMESLANTIERLQADVEALKESQK